MKYVCNICGWVYDEDEKGVKWEDLPEDFACVRITLPRNNEKRRRRYMIPLSFCY